MIELVEGAIYKSTSGRVKYTGIDRFHGEQTFRFKRLERIGTDYVLPSEIEKFLCIEKTREELAAMNDELVAMNKELLAALEAVIEWYDMEADHSIEPDFYKRIAACKVSEDMAREAISKAKGTS